jgi:uncharacterized membrane protein YkoI
MKRNRKLLIAAASALALAAGGVGIAQAVGGDSEEQASGPEADRAKRAAVEALGGGRVVGVERDDESGGAWEVELVRDDGRQVEVHLDANLEQVAVEGDDDGAGDRDEGEENDD